MHECYNAERFGFGGTFTPIFTDLCLLRLRDRRGCLDPAQRASRLRAATAGRLPSKFCMGAGSNGRITHLDVSQRQQRVYFVAAK